MSIFIIFFPFSVSSFTVTHIINMSSPWNMYMSDHGCRMQDLELFSQSNKDLRVNIFSLLNFRL